MDEGLSALGAEVPPLPAVHGRVRPQLVGPGERPPGAIRARVGPLPLSRGEVDGGFVEPEGQTFSLALCGTLPFGCRNTVMKCQKRQYQVISWL